MSYTVLARKYRPQVFADLAGQEHVSRTLANAIAEGRVAHAFLFTGARGVGKTTTARLLAKALNCEQGPTASPCNQCGPCREITAGNDLDVLEIDGASNNSVDDVRRLQETLPFRPARDRFKVVIVDEVHMLSSGAFNAFLKTLEEPPEHVKFIFATTEVHKVPITIRSRCQRYDFRLIPRNVVATRIKAILSQEQISADEEAISIVVREADGSMRDALTVLDQLLAFGGRAGLVGEEVARGLGIADRKLVLSVAQALLDGDAATCLRGVASVSDLGLDIMHFARQLLTWLRDLVVLRVVGDGSDLVDRSDDERAHAAGIAGKHSAQHLERSFAGLAKLVEEVGEATEPQLILEMGLVRLADRPPLEPLGELLSRLQALEQRLASGGPGPGPGRDPSGGGDPGSRGPRRPPGPGPGQSAVHELRPPARLEPRGGDVSWRDGSGAGDAAPSHGIGPRAIGNVDGSNGEARAVVAPASLLASTLANGPANGPGGSLSQAGSAALRAAPAPSPAVGLPSPAPALRPAVPSPATTARLPVAPAAAAVSLRAAIPSGEPVPRPLSPPAPRPEMSGPAVRPPAAGTAGADSRVRDALLAPPAPPPGNPRASDPGRVAMPPAEPPTRKAAPAQAPIAAGEPLEMWSRVLEVLCEAQPALGAVLEHAVPLEVGPERFVLGFTEGSFHGRQAASALTRQALTDAAERMLGSRPQVEVRFGTWSQPSLASQETARRQKARDDMRDAALNHPRVKDAMDVFPEAGEGPVDVQPEDNR